MGWILKRGASAAMIVKRKSIDKTVCPVWAYRRPFKFPRVYFATYEEALLYTNENMFIEFPNVGMLWLVFYPFFWKCMLLCCILVTVVPRFGRRAINQLNSRVGAWLISSTHTPLKDRKPLACLLYSAWEGTFWRDKTWKCQEQIMLMVAIVPIAFCSRRPLEVHWKYGVC